MHTPQQLPLYIRVPLCTISPLSCAAAAAAAEVQRLRELLAAYAGGRDDGGRAGAGGGMAAGAPVEVLEKLQAAESDSVWLREQLTTTQDALHTERCETLTHINHMAVLSSRGSYEKACSRASASSSFSVQGCSWMCVAPLTQCSQGKHKHVWDPMCTRGPSY